MAIFRGKLFTTRDESTANYAVEVRLTSLIKTERDAKPPDVLLLPVSGSTRAGADGAFSLVIESEGELQGPVEVIVSAPNGVEVKRQQLQLVQALRPLELRFEMVAPFSVSPGSDPTLGQRFRVTGRVIDERGRAVPAGLPTVIWGIGQSQNDTDPMERPLVISVTQVNGIFSGEWPADALDRAFGRVAGSSPVPVPLDENRRIVRDILLVINLDDVAAETDKETACDGQKAPPRAPDPVDLTANPEAFSQDLGGSCVDLTMPNRAVEEFNYSFVVRTSEPNVKGVTLGRRQKVPTDLLVDLLGVSIASTALGINAPRAVRLPTAELGLDVHTARALVRGDRPPSLAEVNRAAWLSEVSFTKGLIDAGLSRDTGRAVLDADHPIDWDHTPTIYLAMDVAHGHILRYKEVWRVDGFSLGDLLYSLPLAPGQRRQIAVVDWERRATSARSEQLEFEEELDALLSRDRDVQEIVGSQLHEETSAGSRNTTYGVAGGIGAGFIGGGFGIFGGVAGGAGGSDSNAWQRSSRRFSADSLQRLRDRVAQRASAVRNERSTVVQTVAQGETLRAETEVVANYNHCHAITIEYFEVLRHFLVTHELADVQECLFVPLPMAQFDRAKALRWREPLSRYLKDRSLRRGFGAIERIADDWVGWDFPEARYSEEAPHTLEGELRLSFLLPRPRDAEDGAFQVSMWGQIAPFLPVDALELFTAKLNERTARDRDRVFRQEIAPEIAKNLVGRLRFAYVTADGGETEIRLDATLVSRYRESQPLYISLNPAGDLANVPREDVAHFKIWYDGPALPPDAKVIVHNGRLRYRTEHMTALLFDDRRIVDDIRGGDPVVISTPVTRRELRNPRDEDVDHADRLVAHLNEQLEFYHQVIWLSLDAQRRYMLLDAVMLPGGDKRSIASVCANEVIGIVGNSLVLPVAPGQRLDPTLKTTDQNGNPVDLANAYATAPAPPLRVSVPTRGVYAEAISGDCNACEEINDARYWRWTTEGQLSLPQIDTVSTGTRASDEPDLTPAQLPAPLVAIQNAPELPAPFGLEGAFELLSKPELFRDITGLEGTQRNARAAFDAALSAASSIGGEAAKLAKQQELGRSSARMLDRIHQAREDGLLSQSAAQDLAASTLRGLIGEGQPKPEQPTSDKAVNKVLDESAQSGNVDIKVSTPDETVEISVEDGAPSVGAASLPPVPALLDVGPPASLGFVDQNILLDSLAGAGPGTRAINQIKIDTYAKLQAVVGPPDLTELETLNMIRQNPADASKFQLLRRLRIGYPAPAGSPDEVSGAGRLPVVVFVHGQHASWTGAGEVPNHEGYTYLQEELAEHDIVSVSVDTNAANFFGSFIDMRAEMVMGALDAMRTLDADKNSRFHGRLDLGNVALVGHSRGGDAVIQAAELNAARPAATHFGLKAVCALAPTDFTGTLVAGDVRSLTGSGGLFLAVVYGALDGDVSGAGGAEAITGTGFRHYDRAGCDKAMVFIDHCNHNRFNRTWSNDDFGMLPTDVSGRLLSRRDHEQLAKEFIGGLVRWKLLGQRPQKGLFDGSKANTVGAGVSLQWSLGARVKTLDNLEGISPQVGARILNNGTIEKLQNVKIGPRELNDETNHSTRVLLVSPGLAFPVLPALELAVPAGEQDWSGFDALTLRVGAVYDVNSQTAINTGPLPQFNVLITDAAGGSSVLASTTIATAVTPRRPVFHDAVIGISRIDTSSAANPTVMTTDAPHGLTDGDRVFVDGHTGSTPALDGIHNVTVLSSTTFSIPVDVTVAGAGGLVKVLENCTAQRMDTMEVQLAAVRLDPGGADLAQVRSVAIVPPLGFPIEMFFDSLQLIQT